MTVAESCTFPEGKKVDHRIEEQVDVVVVDEVEVLEKVGDGVGLGGMSREVVADLRRVEEAREVVVKKS